MRRGVSLRLLLILAISGLGMAVAQAETGSIGASVIAPLTLSESSTLEFGQLQSSGTAGTVVIDATDGRTATGGTTLEGGTVQSGTWSVQGESSTAYTITLPESDVVLSSGSDSMIVTDFTDSEGGSAVTDGAGTDSFSIGATLNVGAEQAEGDYSGSYQITIAYQ